MARTITSKNTDNTSGSNSDDEKKRRVGLYCGKYYQLPLSVGPVDLYLYEDGFKKLKKYIKTSTPKVLKFLKSHHMTPIHRILKYETKKTKEKIVFSDKSVYAYVSYKAAQYNALNRQRKLLPHERARYNHYSGMSFALFEWCRELLLSCPQVDPP